MRRISLLSLGLLLAALAAPSAWAQDDEDIYSRTGFYLGVSALAGFEDFEIDGPGSQSVDINDDVSGGLLLRAGYRLEPRVSVEFDAEWLSKFDAQLGGTDAVKQIDRVWGLTGNVKGHLPLGRLQPYAKLGLGYVHATVGDGKGPSSGVDDVDDGAGRFAGGLDYYATERIVLNVEGAYYQSFQNELNWASVSAGITVRFGY